MITYLRKGGARLGMDRAIGYTVVWRMLAASGGAVTIFFVARFLTNSEQGYYYTFTSLLSIGVFFELGLSGIITQFVAHENAYLTWTNDRDFAGPDKYTSRLSSLLRFAVKWFFVISILSFITLTVTGFIFFNYFDKRDANVNWRMPYLLLCLVSNLQLNTTQILAFLEGLGKVQQVAKVRLTQQAIYLVALLIFFVSGFKLYATPLASAAGFLYVIFFIVTRDRIVVLKSIWQKIGDWKVKYLKEILPLQWRIALSWISFYFMYQLLNPILFATEGAVVAGQMGLTLTALSGIFAIALSWINTKAPLFSSLVAQQDFKGLNHSFKKAVTPAAAVSAFCIVCLVGFVATCNFYGFAIGKRFLPVLYLLLFSVAMFSNHIVYALAVYLRSHKKEPFLLHSIVMSVLSCLVIVVFGKMDGVRGITISFALLTTLIGLTWAITIFQQKRKEWHKI